METLVLDEFLLAVDDVEPAVPPQPNIAGAEPAVGRKRLAGSGLIPKVSLRHDGAFDEELAGLTLLDVAVGLVDDAHADVGHERADAAGEVGLAPGHDGHGAGRLAQAPGLADVDAEFAGGEFLELFAHGRGAGDGGAEVGLKLVFDEGALGDEEVDGRDGEEGCDLVFLVIGEEEGEVESRHPVDGTARNDGVDEVALAAGDVRCGEVGEGAVGEGWFFGVGGDVGAEHVLRNKGFGNCVRVGEEDGFGDAGRAG